ncbi:hypothetical protein DP193_18460 [Enterobacter hormaechei subsp. oharae]|nr:hypothetical protein DP193_18460 [Enterobacter hormaechei subsp. oharae]
MRDLILQLIKSSIYSTKPNSSHWRTSYTTSYTKSVSWQHHLAAESMNNNALTGYFIAPCQKSYILSRFLLSHTG